MQRAERQCRLGQLCVHMLHGASARLIGERCRAGDGLSVCGHRMILGGTCAWTHLIVTWVVTRHACEVQHAVQLAHRVQERRGEEPCKPRLGACVALLAMYETANL